MNAAKISEQLEPEKELEQERGSADKYAAGQRRRNVTIIPAISPTNGLVFHSAIIGGVNAHRFCDFLAQIRLNFDPGEHITFIYDGAPAHHNPADPQHRT